MEVSFDFEAIAALGDEIGDMADRAENLAPVLTPAAALLNTVIDKSFETSSGALGESWAPLKQKTIDRRRQNSSKPLVDTGLLRGSVTTRAEGSRVLFGISGAATLYGPTHQFGSGAIPARPFLPVSGGRADFSGGRAKQWFDRTLKRVQKYILGT